MAEDILVRMYDMQRDLQLMIPRGITSPDPNVPLWDDDDMAKLREQVLAMTDELHEFLRETRWKPWTTGPVFVNPEAQKELTDAFLFFMNLMILIGMTPHDLFYQYQLAHAKNVHRHADGAYSGNVIMNPTAA